MTNIEWTEDDIMLLVALDSELGDGSTDWNEQDLEEITQ